MAYPKEIAELYQTSKQNIGKHIKAIFAEQELDDSVVNFQFTTAADGKNYRWNVFQTVFEEFVTEHHESF